MSRSPRTSPKPMWQNSRSPSTSPSMRQGWIPLISPTAALQRPTSPPASTNPSASPSPTMTPRCSIDPDPGRDPPPDPNGRPNLGASSSAGHGNLVAHTHTDSWHTASTIDDQPTPYGERPPHPS